MGTRRRRGFRVLAAVAVAGLLLSGCGQNELGRYTGYQPDMWVVKDPKRIRNQIVKSENYWVQKEVEPEEQFGGPTPDDLRSPEDDYILGSGDLIDITVFELMVPGQSYVTRQRISQSGQMTFPYLGTVKAADLTTRGLEEKLADILEPDYLVDPQVTVFVAEYRNLSVSILNGVMRAGLYPMSKQDMTLLELVAMAGGVLQLVEDYGYVIREYSPEEADLLMLEGGAAPAEGEKKAAGEEAAATPAEEKPAEGTPAAEKKAPEGTPPAEEKAPAADAPKKADEKGTPGSVAPAPAASDPASAPTPKAPDASATEDTRRLLERMAEGEMPQVKRIEAAETAAAVTQPASPSPAPPGDEDELERWIWSDGKWVQVKTPKPAAEPTEAAKPAHEGKPVEPVRVAKGPETTPEQPIVDDARLTLERKLQRLGVVQGSGQLKRIIRFDVRALQGGDPTQNVVLRDGDIITIPSPPVGDFYMAGEVARPGVYSLTGRKITLLQAVAAAGGLTAVAVPWRTELVRRISETEEEIIYADLGKISRGEAPDFYVQPEDQIRVGTDQGAVYNAVLRNAFRATYGLGAVYDMNFADFYPWTDSIQPIFDTPF
ncbi:MAG TPA: polysaccharide biosynthesis/export family protein [Phycisphaerae bacterium]|nr:polysaccharide biosynthesis/export family protein [Phycisphaerae bacterium]